MIIEAKEDELALAAKLREAGASDEMITEYRRYLAGGNRHGQADVLCRLKKLQTERLRMSREKLACLDYIIARMEKTHSSSL